MNEYKRILLADDDSEDREMILDAFEEVGICSEVFSGENGEDIVNHLQACQNPGDLPCLIILDLNMPKMNGRETLRYIKSQEQFRHITVIIYSTSINPIEKEACLRLGAHSYITKPVQYSELIQTAALLKSYCYETVK